MESPPPSDTGRPAMPIRHNQPNTPPSTHYIPPEQVARKIEAKKNPDPDDAEKYVVPHSAITYVLGPDGEFFTHFTDATEASDMAHALARLP